ncbi:MAG: VWA domain-containing protein [Deltaproteobacteria bacterium]|nr:VWA domain-containing protein [Deltaproteobacteria bacterium]
MDGDSFLNISRKGERTRGSAVHLEDVARSLRIYAQALCGRRFVLKPLDELPASPTDHFWRTRSLDRETIFLPKVFERFSTPFVNFLAFKLAVAHQAGYVEFGTFSFKLSSVYDLFPPGLFLAGLRSICKETVPASPLEIFFRLFPNREMARDLFHILEGARIDHSLRRGYRGLRQEMDAFLQEVLADRQPAVDLPLQESLIDHVLRVTVGGREGEDVPQPLLSYLSALEALPSLIDPLLERGATVVDSARATVALYEIVSPVPNVLPDAFLPQIGEERRRALSGTPFDAGNGRFAAGAAEGVCPYKNMAPLPHRAPAGPELLQHKLTPRKIRPLLNGKAMGQPLSPEALRELLEKGLEIDALASRNDGEREGHGLTLLGPQDVKGPAGRIRETTDGAPRERTWPAQSFIPEDGEVLDRDAFTYDEWDYRIGDYRVEWCRLKELPLKGERFDFIARTLESHAGLVKEVRKQFQMLKPELFKKIPQLESGEEIDLNAAVDASVDRRAGLSPSEKIYIEREHKERDFSTLFLLDMSASTNDRVDGKAGGGSLHPLPTDRIFINPRFYDPDYVASCAAGEPEGKRVIDIEKEALVIMAEALEEIGDEYAIYGFSSYGRANVEFYTVKDFDDAYDEEVKKRIDAIEPRRSTRMGTAVRHALSKISGRRAKTKNIILISDGYPQDHDYGEDRSGVEYGLQDTKMAIQETARRNAHLFCITVDLAGNDYLRRMCQDSQYLVIEQTEELPRVLPKIYRRLTT